jgi:hypothetical protein
MTRPIFKAKMLVICFDVVALFYIFATLFMGDMGEVHLIHMPLIVHVGVWSYLWIWKFVIFSKYRAHGHNRPKAKRRSGLFA